MTAEAPRIAMTRTFPPADDELKAAMKQVEAETGDKPIAATRYRCEEGEILVFSLTKTYVLGPAPLL